MGYSRKQFQAIGFDEVEWQSYYHRRQQSYIRLKLQSIKLYWQGKSVSQIAQLLVISPSSIRHYLRIYLASGLNGLSQAA
jgi:hypothetical protein